MEKFINKYIQRKNYIYCFLPKPNIIELTSFFFSFRSTKCHLFWLFQMSILILQRSGDKGNEKSIPQKCVFTKKSQFFIESKLNYPRRARLVRSCIRGRVYIYIHTYIYHIALGPSRNQKCGEKIGGKFKLRIKNL